MRRKELLKTLKDRSKQDLEKELFQNKEKLRVLKFNLISGKVKNIREIRKIKKNIARIKTLLTKFNA